MKKQITVCDFCGSDKEVQTIFQKDICRECFEKNNQQSTNHISKSEYSESLTKEIRSIIEKYDLNCPIEKFKNKINLYYISEYQKLSEEFIEKFQDEVCWDDISVNQTLSEEFIEKFQDKVNWKNISIYQTLSEEFIEKFQDKVYWGLISMYQKLSPEFREKWKHKLN